MQTAGSVVRTGKALALALVLGGCVGGGGTTTTTTSTSTTSTTIEVTTTIEATTTIPPTTTTMAPVTDHPNLPVAESRSVVPWEEVDAAWVLALYSGATLDEPGPTALYLASPAGVLYEIKAWEAAGPAPWMIDDWSPERRRALLRYGNFSDLRQEIRLLSLDRGEESILTVAPELSEIAAGFTASGLRVVSYRNSDSEETLEVLYTNGSLFVSLANQTSGSSAPLTWLYGLDGTTVAVGDRSGMHMVSAEGERLHDLDAPGESCRPVRWWDENVILTACIPRGVATAGGTYYQLWLVPADGGVALNLTSVPASPGDSDFGYADAWQTETQVYMQWLGACSMARVDRLFGGGAFPVQASGQQFVVGTNDSGVMLRMWDGCERLDGSLRLVSPEGEVLATLIPPIEGVVGVLSAVMVS